MRAAGDLLTIRGNQDRQIYDATPQDRHSNPTLDYVIKDLGDEPIMARQGDVARVDQWQHVPEQIGLGLVANFVANAVPAEWLLHELAAVVVSNNLADAIAAEQSGEVVDHGRWRERRPHLADSVHDHSFVRPCGPVRNGQRHGILAAARRVDEGAIGDAGNRQHLAMVTDATLDHLERDEALDIGAELGEIFSRCAMRSSGFSGGSQGKGIYTIGTLTRL